MKTSEKITNLTKAMFEFQTKVASVKKSAKNPHFKSTYADLTSILETINPILQECGLLVTQHPHADSLVTTVYHAESGEFMQSEQVLRMKDLSNPQQQGSAITYARRYALAGVFSLTQEDSDDDGNVASGIKINSVKEELTTTHPLFEKAVEYIKGGGNISNITSKYIVNNETLILLQGIK